MAATCHVLRWGKAGALPVPLAERTCSCDRSALSAVSGGLRGSVAIFITDLVLNCSGLKMNGPSTLRVACQGCGARDGERLHSG